MTTLARVAELWVFPVKSMSGSRVEAAAVEDGGLVGDRSWAVVGPDGSMVTAADEPRLREVVPHLVDGELRLEVPGAPAALGPDDAGPALSAWLGRPLRLDHRAGAGFVDVAPVHIVSRHSMADAAHAEQCDACDITAPRANIVLDLGPDAGSERDWVGRKLRVGDVELAVERRPDHCLGVYADVALAGTVRRGDEVSAG